MSGEIKFILTKKFIIYHHPRTAGFVMVKTDKSAITEIPFEIRYVFRENVGMYVDGHRGVDNCDVL